MSRKKDDTLGFSLLGGTKQPIIKTAEDFRKISELDVSFWAITGTQTNSLVCNDEFLKELDTDQNGRIRCDEVLAAMKWVLQVMKDLSGVEAGSDVLKLSYLNENDKDGATYLSAAKIALANIGLSGSDSISFQQISDNEKIVSNSLQNGDGIIPPEQVGDPLCADCIRAIMAITGKVKDLSGADGIGINELNSFQSLAEGYLAWSDEYDTTIDKNLPFAERTEQLYQAVKAIEEKTDDFFRSVATKRFGMKLESSVTTFDPLDSNSVKTFLEKSPICNPGEFSELKRNGEINPLWVDKVEKFFAAYSAAVGKEIDKLSFQDWCCLKNQLSLFGGWVSRKNTSLFDSFDKSKLKEYSQHKVYDTIRNFIEQDKSVSQVLSECKSIRKLILYQKYLMSFLNNFVSLRNIFDVNATSMVKVGKLVMDGRVFTLCTLVPDPAEHKKIVQDSDICVMYLDLVRKDGATEKRMKLAVAVTSGHVRNIFIGKSGVFFTTDGAAWDAKIFDFVKQPVSIPEAMREPFYKFAEFFRKQIDRIFATRSKAFETNVEKNIQTKAAPQPVNAPAPATASPGMMLMGGGIGLAAIGSSFAFITKSLQGISFTTVLAVLLGILLIFGAPIIIMSLTKLFHRNFSRFFEANGNAMNLQLKLTLKMGRFFTYTPSGPKQHIVFSESLSNLITPSKESSANSRTKIVWLIILFVVLLICAVVIYFNFAAISEWAVHVWKAIVSHFHK